MINRDINQNLKFVKGLNFTTITSDTTTNGLAIDISKVVGDGTDVLILLEAHAVTLGDISVVSVDFAEDSGFTTALQTVDIDGILHFNKSDQGNTDDALTQTTLDTANTLSKLGLHIPVVNKPWMRVNFLTQNSANLEASCVVVLTQRFAPVNQ